MSANRMLLTKARLSLRGVKQSLRGTFLADVADKLRHDLHYEDVFLVSFPKSGNTWTRFLLTGVHLWHVNQKNGGQCFTVEPNYFNIHSYIPDLHITNSRAARPTPGLPRILKSHRPATRIFSRVLFVVRDPRDTMLSRFHFLNRGGVVFRSFGEFLRHPSFGISSWVRHTESWLFSSQRNQGRLLFVRFEDLQRQPEYELQRMLGFLNVSVTKECLTWSVRMADRHRVRELEERFGRPRPAPVPFMRNGTSGQWIDAMESKHVKLIEQLAGSTLEKCGYSLSRCGSGQRIQSIPDAAHKASQ